MQETGLKIQCSAYNMNHSGMNRDVEILKYKISTSLKSRALKGFTTKSLKQLGILWNRRVSGALFVPRAFLLRNL